MAYAATTFTDVPASAPFRFDVAWAADSGVISGAANGTFAPNGTVKNQSLALWLYRLANGTTRNPACTSAPYDDVPASSTYCGVIAWMKKQGIANPGRTFGPTTTVTRRTLALYLYRLTHSGAAAPACTTAPYPDVPAATATCGAIAWVRAQGLDNTPPGSAFTPAGAVTRAQTATMLHRTADVLHTVLGADVSSPQCGGALPTGQAFAVVGVNAGKPTTVNPCLATQLQWAATSTGTRGQSRVQLFVNTANPGAEPQRPPSWPTTGTNGYGSCSVKNAVSTACAYEYGRARAREDVAWVATPQAYTWWLDVELLNTWDSPESRLTKASAQRNVAVLEGMVSYFRSVKVAGLGIYSTGYQWRAIVGSAVGSRSALNGLPNWLAGAGSLAQARATCGSLPLTSTGTVRMTQYTDTFNRDHSCV